MIGVAEVRLSFADGGATLEGVLRVPAEPRGLVVFAHGSGSGRLSPRNARVAGSLEHAGLATFLFDLLTPAEQESEAARFDISLMARRLHLAVREARRHREVETLSMGLFGASTGAAAALYVAADPFARIVTVVSRGGRPDLAAPVLDQVAVPVLLIVGGHDAGVLELNRRCIPLLPDSSEVAIVPGATHLFEEPGALEAVAKLAACWFRRHLKVAVRAT